MKKNEWSRKFFPTPIKTEVELAKFLKLLESQITDMDDTIKPKALSGLLNIYVANRGGYVGSTVLNGICSIIDSMVYLLLLLKNILVQWYWIILVAGILAIFAEKECKHRFNQMMVFVLRTCEFFPEKEWMNNYCPVNITKWTLNETTLNVPADHVGYGLMVLTVLFIAYRMFVIFHK